MIDWDDLEVKWISRNWHDAVLAATHSTCSRGRRHGCVLMAPPDCRRLLSRGYNGAAEGDPHCPCERAVPIGGCPAVHAEVNAVINAARLGLRTEGAMAFSTKEPCAHCWGVLRNAGVEGCFFVEPLRKTDDWFGYVDRDAVWRGSFITDVAQHEGQEAADGVWSEVSKMVKAL